MNEAAKLLSALKNASPSAINAYDMIVRMPETSANMEVILAALRHVVGSAMWGDFSQVSEHLDEAAESLDRVYAITDEERAEVIRDSMQTKD